MRAKYQNLDLSFIIGAHNLSEQVHYNIDGSILFNCIREKEKYTEPHTITADNRRELVGHETTAKALEAGVYFAHTHSFWYRGANENGSGILRQYVKKGTDLTTVTGSDIETLYHG